MRIFIIGNGPIANPQEITPAAGDLIVRFNMPSS